MLQVREPLLDSEADSPGGHAVGEEDVADDVPPHEPLALLLACEEGDDQDGHAVRPWEQRVLRPPPRHDQRDVESQHEGQGDGGQLVVAVGHNALEELSRFLPLKSLIGIVISVIVTYFLAVGISSFLSVALTVGDENFSVNHIDQKIDEKIGKKFLQN